MGKELKRISVCEWSLHAKFKTKEQTTRAVKLILNEDIDYDISYSKDHEYSHDVYELHISSMSWAANLKRVATILESVDYQES